MRKSPDAFRTISEVADWLGIQAHVLRFWESKFSQVKPVKRAGGRRYYRPADMVLIGGIKKLLHDDGMTIKGVQKLLREKGVSYVSSLSQSLDDGSSPPEVEAGSDENVVVSFSPGGRENTAQGVEINSSGQVGETAPIGEPVSQLQSGESHGTAQLSQSATASPADGTTLQGSEPAGTADADNPADARTDVLDSVAQAAETQASIPHITLADPPEETQISAAPGALSRLANLSSPTADMLARLSNLQGELKKVAARLENRSS